jgi:cbb3-type cytochrome oxidase subunit 3
MLATFLILLLAAVLWIAFAGRKRAGRDAAAEAARRAVEARLGEDAAAQRDEDSRA